MNLDRSWQDDWAKTWLSDPAYVSTLDHWVRQRHVQYHEAAERQALGSSGLSLLSAHLLHFAFAHNGLSSHFIGKPMSAICTRGCSPSSVARRLPHVDEPAVTIVRR